MNRQEVKAMAFSVLVVAALLGQSVLWSRLFGWAWGTLVSLLVGCATGALTGWWVVRRLR